MYQLVSMKKSRESRVNLPTATYDNAPINNLEEEPRNTEKNSYPKQEFDDRCKILIA